MSDLNYLVQPGIEESQYLGIVFYRKGLNSSHKHFYSTVTTASCGISARKRCNADSGLASIETVEFRLGDGHHLACSLVCLSFELSSGSRNRVTSVSGPNEASGGSLMEFRFPSTSRLEEYGSAII